MKYHVLMNCVASASIEVEAEDKEMAIEAAYAKGLPSLMFTDHRYPDETDWMAANEEIHVPASTIEETVFEA